MKLEEVGKISDNLDEKQKNAILNLIDIKTESDMEKVISEIRALKTEIEHKTESLKTEFRTEINYLKWIGGAILVAIISVIIKSFF